ncbi:MAG: acetylornithine deacetylase [Pseudomonadota bacterium]
MIPKLHDLIHTLIGTPSVSCMDCDIDQSNLAVIGHLAAWCETLGFKTEVLPIPGNPGKSNLIATLGDGPGGLVLSGHTDTVPYDDTGWHSDPFRLTERDGRFYGLGTADMKSFLALALEAVSPLHKETFHQPLILLATADEETGMCGAKELVKMGRPKARYAVVGEPTDLRPVRLHKGIMMDAIYLRGQSGHSSNPALGNNALEGMHEMISALLAWRQQLQATWQNPAFEVNVPTLNLGHIHGGDNPNRICADCELHIDLRPLPGMSLEELRGQLGDIAQKVAHARGLELEMRVLFDGIEAMETPPQSNIVQAAEQLTKHPAEAVAFGTEGPYLNSLGMETVVLGPGSIDQAHQPNEFISLDSLQPTLGILTQLIHRFCLTPQPANPAPVIS